jgi:hypothetical protein
MGRICLRPPLDALSSSTMERFVFSKMLEFKWREQIGEDDTNLFWSRAEAWATDTGFIDLHRWPGDWSDRNAVLSIYTETRGWTGERVPSLMRMIIWAFNGMAVGIGADLLPDGTVRIYGEGYTRRKPPHAETVARHFEHPMNMLRAYVLGGREACRRHIVMNTDLRRLLIDHVPSGRLGT